MLAKAQWFQKRKYTGWGVNPKTWQGWVYIALFICVLVGLQSVSVLSVAVRNVISIVLVVFVLVDTLQVMAKFDKDELEEKNEAIAERNASWAMVVILTVGILYPIISTGAKDVSDVNPFLLVALVVGFVVKATSYFILEKK